MKHFEHIWEEAEEIAPTNANLPKMIELLKESNSPENMGELLFLLSGISKNFDIDVWEQLEKAIENYKVENYG